MTTYQRALRLSIYLGNADVRDHKALSREIVHRAHRAGLRGATTLQGIKGYGHSHKIHDTPKWSLLDRTPITVHIIDTPDRIRAFLPRLDDVATNCLIVCDEVQVAVEPGARGTCALR
jgi:PII-like signaling protein